MRHSRTSIRWQTEAAQQYHEHVELAESYLKGRDLYDSDVLDTYCLGVVVDPWPEHKHYTGRLSIPYLTPAGVVDIKFRCIRDHECKDIPKHAKYIGTSARGERLYNVQALHDAEDILYVAGGEINAITATIVGYPTVAGGGESKWQDHWLKLFEDFDQVIALVDGDKAGERFADRFLHEVDNGRVIFMPDGEDVNSVVVNFGDSRLREVVEEAKILT